MKTLAGSWLRKVLAAMPSGAKMAIIDGVCDHPSAFTDPFMVLARLASRCGITEFCANGQYGTIRSSSSDIVIFATYAQTGTWAPRTNSLLCEFFRRAGGGTYLDVGANIGLTTIPVAKQASVRCIAFEPEPTNFENLRVNIDANCSSCNVEIRQVAVYDRPS
jgi:hypothetical protein